MEKRLNVKKFIKLMFVTLIMPLSFSACMMSAVSLLSSAENSNVGSSGEYNAADFFNKTPGYGIHYNVTDNGSTDVDSTVWVIHQDTSTQPPNENYDFITTLVEHTNTSGYFRNSTLAGYYEQDSGEGVFYRYNTGAPSGNQVNYYFDASLPTHFNIPTSWTAGYGNEQHSYELTRIGDYSVGGSNFSNCIQVDYITTTDNAYTTGGGYYVLSPGFGIVDLVFNRSDGSTAQFEYIESQQFSTKYTLSGTVEDSGGTGVENVEVQIGNLDFGIGDTTDASGTFSLQTYGPDIILYVGYDNDGDGVLDFDQPTNDYPFDYKVSGLTGDRSGITISLP